MTLRKRIAYRLYYAPTFLVPFNPTRLCNWLLDARLYGERYNAFGGARWLRD